MPNLDVWYSRLDVEDLMSSVRTAARRRRCVKRPRRTSPRPRTKDSMQAFAKLTHDGRRRAADHQRPAADRAGRGAAPGRPADQSTEELHEFVRGYRRTLQTDRRSCWSSSASSHLARKVVGVGSVGTRAWIALLLGRDGQRSAVPAGQGGAGLGARGLRRQERVRQPRRAGRGGPAPDAGHQRHLPGLAADGQPASTASSATSTCAS